MTIRIYEIIKYISVRLFYVMFLIVIFNILSRYLFNINFIYLQEIVMYLHAFIFLFGISLCMRDDAHVKIDIFSSKLRKSILNKINSFGYICFVMPFAIFVIYVSTPMIFSSWSIMEGSSEAGGLPFVYLLKSSIYLFATLLIAEVIHKLFTKK